MGCRCLAAQAKQLTDYTVNANLGNPFSWYKDNENILVKCFLKQSSITRWKKLTGPIVSMARYHLIEPTKIY
jgi:hypothetical protein